MILQNDDTYFSENGDHWRLIRDQTSDRVYIRHEAKIPTGWTVTYTDACDFFQQDSDAPEFSALRGMLNDHRPRHAPTS
jgi:hypothetical protein